MTDVLKTSGAWLESQRVAFRTIPVVFKRSSQTATVNASISRSNFDLDDEGGGVLRIETRDYLVAASELAAAGIAFPPALGDLFTETAGTGTLDYEVIIPAKAIPAWRWDDRFHTRLRIHTALVTQET